MSTVAPRGRPSYLLAFVLSPLYFARRRRWDLVTLYGLLYSILLGPTIGMAAAGGLLGGLVLPTILGVVGVCHARYEAVARPAPPQLSRGRRCLEGFVMLGVFIAMIIAILVLQDNRVSDAVAANRVQEARWEAEWIAEQGQRHQQTERHSGGGIEALVQRWPSANIAAMDPWGRPWVMSPALQSGPGSANPTDVWICSRGAEGTGECPPSDVAAGELAGGGSVGFSAQRGGWGRPRENSPLRVTTDVIAVLVIPGAPIAYAGYRLTRRLRGRPVPALRGGLALLAFVLIVSLPGVVGMVLFEVQVGRARQANATAGVCSIAAAITEYRTHTGRLPPALRDLTGPVTNSQGLVAGPFLATLPRSPGQSSYIYKRGIGETFSVRYRDPQSLAVVARAP